MSLIVLCFLHSTSVLSFYKDVVLTLSTKRSYQIVRFKKAFLCVFHQYFSAYVAKCKLLLKKANLRDLIAATGLVFLPKTGFKLLIFLAHVTMKFYGKPWKTIGHLFYTMSALCITSKPSVISNWSYSPETPNLSQNGRFFSPVTSKFDRWPWKTIGHLFYVTSSFVFHFIAICQFKMEFQSGKAKFGSKSVIFLSRVTLKFDGWTWKTIRHLFYATSSFVHHFIAICQLKMEL